MSGPARGDAQARDSIATTSSSQSLPSSAQQSSGPLDIEEIATVTRGPRRSVDAVTVNRTDADRRTQQRRTSVVRVDDDEGINPLAVRRPSALVESCRQALRTSYQVWRKTDSVKAQIRVVGDDSDSDEDDEVLRQFTIAETERKLRKQKSSGVLSASESASLRSKVLEKMGCSEEEPREHASLSIRWQRRLGILELRVKIAIKRLSVETAAPYFPFARAVVSSLRFEGFIAFLILLNAISMGAELQYGKDEKRPGILMAAEHIFCLVFLIEFFLRIMSYSWVWLFQPINMFDAFLIWFTGVTVTWILIPLQIDAAYVQRLGALRVLRLARLCRAIRMIPAFHELWMLVRGIVECIPLLFWAAIIIGLVIFGFAVAVLETVTKSESYADDPFVNAWFGDMGSAMFTLFQIMTFDSWAAIVRPIIVGKMPEAAALFLLFIGLAGLVLFNLMTAIVVKNAFDAAEADEEAVAQLKVQQHVKFLEELKAIFNDLDEDQSGYLSKEEFTDVLNDVLFVQKMKMLDIDLEELPDIFDILDDGDGQVTTEEFCDGIMGLQGTAKSKDVLKAQSSILRVNGQMLKLSDTLDRAANDVWDDVEESFDTTRDNILDLQGITADLLDKVNQVGIRQMVCKTVTEIPQPPEPAIFKADAKGAKKKRARKAAAQERSTSPDRSPPPGHLRALPVAFLKERRQKQQAAAVRLSDAARGGTPSGEERTLTTAQRRFRHRRFECEVGEFRGDTKQMQIEFPLRPSPALLQSLRPWSLLRGAAEGGARAPEAPSGEPPGTQPAANASESAPSQAPAVPRRQRGSAPPQEGIL